MTDAEFLPLALRDATLRGWFNSATGELFTGFGAAPDDVVLDVGCGDGRMVGFLARSGARFILVDIEPQNVSDAINRLRQNGAERVEGHVSDCAPLPLGDALADRVICTEVLEHVENPAALLAELTRVARPGALFLLTVPDPLAEGVQRRVAPDLYWRKPNHLRVFSRDDFARMVISAGLLIERSGCYGFYHSLWWATFWCCGVSLDLPEHPALRTLETWWRTLLDTPGGDLVKHALDEAMPKSQLILARKPS